MPTNRDQADTRGPSATDPAIMVLAGGLETTGTAPSGGGAPSGADGSGPPVAQGSPVAAPSGYADQPTAETGPTGSGNFELSTVGNTTLASNDPAASGIATLVGSGGDEPASTVSTTDVIHPTVRGIASEASSAGPFATAASPAAPSVRLSDVAATAISSGTSTTFPDPNAPFAVPYSFLNFEAAASGKAGSSDIRTLAPSAVGAGSTGAPAVSVPSSQANLDPQVGHPIAAVVSATVPAATIPAIAVPTVHAVDPTVVEPGQAVLATSAGPSLAATAAIALDLQGPGTTFGNGGDETSGRALGNTGSGITVGILSDSFNTSGNADTMATDIANGYLPRNTQILQDSPGGSDEGRAMAQIVHEVAPGANILFATADNTQQEFANNILALANAGAKVIVDDFLYYAEPNYQDGVVAQAVEKVESEGVVYLTSAQNNASQGYEGAFEAGNTFTFEGQSFIADDFSPGNPLLKINGGSFGAVVNLEWETPSASASNAATGGTGGPGASSDLALFLVNAAGQVVGGNGNANSIGDDPVLGGDPIQQVIVNPGQVAYLEVGLLSGSTAPADLKITADDDDGDVTLGPASSNINDGTMSGHAGAPGIIAVGAADYDQTPAYGSAQPVNEAFSSAGPITIDYADDGQPLATPRVATVAATGVDGDITSFFGESTSAGDSFFGTSAAAPSLAGVAALMLQENSALTPADVKNLLEDSATLQPTVNSSGVADPNVGGAGLVDGQVAIQFSQLLNGGLDIDADNTVLGSHFADRLTPDSNTATMTGFAGADTFVITASDAGYALAGGAPDSVTDYDQGNSGAYAENEGDTIDLSGVYASYARAGEATDGFARVLTVLGTGIGQVQVMSGSSWTTVANLDGVRFQDAVSASVQKAGTDGVLQAVTTVATTADLNTVTSDLAAATVSDGRYVIEVTTGGLSSNAGFMLPGSVTLQTDNGTTTLGGALSNEAGSLVKAGPGTLVLGSGGSTFSGGTTIAGGSLELDAPAVGLATNFTSGVAGEGRITFAPVAGSTATLRLDQPAQPTAGATFGNALQGFGNNDVLDLADYSYTPGLTEAIYNSQNETLTVEELIAATGVASDQETFILQDPTPNALGQFFVASDGEGGTIVDNGTACFLPGSSIATPGGEVPVERLCPGMAVSVLENGAITSRTVRWVGRGWSDGRDPAGLDRYPVRLRAGSIRNGVPTRDLLVTAEHCVLLDGGLVPARMLVNGASIVADQAITSFEFFHVELDRHGILLAEGLEVESYLDTGNRANFRGGAVTALRPSFEVEADHAAWSTDAAAPLTVAREAVEPIWRRLAARAATMGLAVPVPATLVAEPDVHLVTEAGLRLDPVFRDGIAHGFVVPAGTTALRLVSRSSRPSEVVGPFLDDRRRLGVLVGAVTITGDGRRFGSTAHLSAAMLAGWQAREEGSSGRWTDGNAVLGLDALPTAEHGALITLEILAGGPYLAAKARQDETNTAEQLRAA